jgi:hypothetical protein
MKKPFDAIKTAAIIDTIQVTFLFFIAGSLLIGLAMPAFENSIPIEWASPLVVLGGIISGSLFGFINYHHWMKRGYGWGRRIFLQ